LSNQEAVATQKEFHHVTLSRANSSQEELKQIEAFSFEENSPPPSPSHRTLSALATPVLMQLDFT
jgi:hypothetical protein